MPKRTLDALAGDKNGHPHKKQHRKQDRTDWNLTQHDHEGRAKSKTDDPPVIDRAPVSHVEALAKLPPQTSVLNAVPPYTSFNVWPDIPELPPVNDGPLSTAPFRHKSTITYDRSTVDTTQGDISYERLEFLGDTYVELMASRLIYSRLPHLPAGQMSQLREQLVKNETLCEYGQAYGFHKRVAVGDMTRMQFDAREKGNKGFNKIIGDVFEAYVAAVVLSDPEEGFAVAEKWLTALWAPRLTSLARADRFYSPNIALTNDPDADPRQVYDPAAKNELQRRIMRDNSVRLAYEPYKTSVELKGAQLGQNRHFIAVYLTGYGYQRELLGKGEGKNKVEAGNWAATEAMHGSAKKIVDECEKAMLAAKAARAAEKPSKEEANAAQEGVVA